MAQLMPLVMFTIYDGENRKKPREKQHGNSHGNLGAFYTIYQKIPENFGNFGGKCLSVKDLFHLAHSSHLFPGFLRRPMYFPPKYKMGAQLLLLNEILDFSLEEESLVNSDDDNIPILAAVATYMWLDLHKNKGLMEIFCLCIYMIDEFKSHFTMIRGTFEALCREAQATGGSYFLVKI